MARSNHSSDLVSSRFNRLLKELLTGEIKRNSFLPWEVDLLLDIQACPVRNSLRRQLLRRYQKAVNRELERGASTPYKFSEYIRRNGARSRRNSTPMLS